jgi:hypothetical protein
MGEKTPDEPPHLPGFNAEQIRYLLSLREIHAKEQAEAVHIRQGEIAAKQRKADEAAARLQKRLAHRQALLESLPSPEEQHSLLKDMYSTLLGAIDQYKSRGAPAPEGFTFDKIHDTNNKCVSFYITTKQEFGFWPHREGGVMSVILTACEDPSETRVIYIVEEEGLEHPLGISMTVDEESLYTENEEARLAMACYERTLQWLRGPGPMESSE